MKLDINRSINDKRAIFHLVKQTSAAVTNIYLDKDTTLRQWIKMTPNLYLQTYNGRTRAVVEFLGDGFLHC